MDYDQYLSTFASDPEDGDDPTIEKLKYNALFAEEDGFVIVLPGFKPHRYEIKPAPEPLPESELESPKYNKLVYESLEVHDRIIQKMKEMALEKNGKHPLERPRPCCRYHQHEQRRANNPSANPKKKKKKKKKQQPPPKKRVDDNSTISANDWESYCKVTDTSTILDRLENAVADVATKDEN